MKHFVKLLLLVIFPFALFAQNNEIKDFDIELGKPYKVVDSHKKLYFYSDNTLLTFKFVKEDLTIQKINTTTLRLESSKIFKDFPAHYVPEFIWQEKSNFYLFYSLWDKKNQKEQLFYREIDLAKGGFIGKGKLLISVDGKITGSIAGTGKLYGVQIVDKFKYNSSTNDSLLLIRYRKKPTSRNNAKSKDVIGFHVFDKSFNEIWNKQVRMPYTEEKMNNVDYHIDNKGNVYILAYVFKGKSTEIDLKDGKPNYHIEVIKVKPNDNNITQFRATLDNKLINSITLYQGNDDDLILAGFYTNSKKYIHDAKGIFYMKIDEEGSIIDKSTFEFPLSLLNQNASNKTKRKNKKKDGEKAELSNLSMDKIIVEQDGSITLIGEQVYTIYTRSGKFMNVTNYFNDILIAKIKSDGTLSWIKKLPKRQYGRNTGKKDMSYKHFVSGNYHNFLFMDNASNINLDLSEEPKAHVAGVGGYLTQYSINSTTGAFLKSHVFNSREVEGMTIYQFTPDRITEISDGIYVIEVYKKNKQDILIKVTDKNRLSD